MKFARYGKVVHFKTPRRSYPMDLRRSGDYHPYTQIIAKRDMWIRTPIDEEEIPPIDEVKISRIAKI